MQLPNGRYVYLIRFIIIGTYSGIYEGSRDEVSFIIHKEITERAARISPPSDPLVIIEPPKGDLPPWFCVAQLESPESVNISVEDYLSGLYVYWFIEDYSENLDKIIESIFPQIDWETIAQNYPLFL